MNENIVVDHMGRQYLVVTDNNLVPYYLKQNINIVFVPRENWRISLPYDLYFSTGGRRYYITKTGELVGGTYNDFPQNELLKIYKLLKGE